MTLKGFKNLLAVMLTGDNIVPSDNDLLVAAIDYSLKIVADASEPLVLMTLDHSVPIIRLGLGDYAIRRYELPEDDLDELDIDEDLVPVVARLVASLVSKEKGAIHSAIANKLMIDHNAKVYDIVSQMSSEEELVDGVVVNSDCIDGLDTEFKDCTTQSTEFAG